MTVPAAIPPSLLKRWFLETFAVRTSAGEVYLATVEAVLVFDIAVLAERSILLISAAALKCIPAAVSVAVEISAVIKSALTVESATFLTFSFAFEAVATLVESATFSKAIVTRFIPVIAPTILDFFFFRA